MEKKKPPSWICAVLFGAAFFFSIQFFVYTACKQCFSVGITVSSTMLFMATTTPDELKRLWAERDRRQSPEAELPAITLEDADETSEYAILDSLDDLEPGCSQSANESEPDYSVTPAVTAMGNVVCFPTYKLNSKISLAKYESRYERRLRRSD